MDDKSAYKVLSEMQDWRRERPPYDGEDPETHRPMPYSAREFGMAMDVALKALEKLQHGVWLDGKQGAYAYDALEEQGRRIASEVDTMADGDLKEAKAKEVQYVMEILQYMHDTMMEHSKQKK